MKKVTLIICLFFYLISTSGLAVNTHYCGGKLSNISIVFESKSKCKCGAKKMNRNCCKDQKHFFKVKDAHKSSADLKLTFKNYAAPLFISTSSSLLLFHQSPLSIKTNSSFIDVPPDVSLPPVYLLNSTFLI